ncbi:MAG: hypothetical protein KAT68_16135 [Bacteroidales bacterium]|nr:hypothetical protein [Bacteroidales bacterium]
MKKFLASEVRFSVGKYVIVDHGEKNKGILRVISSIGYPGGYIFKNDDFINISTTLSPILSRLKTREIKFHNDALIRYYEKYWEWHLPFSTIFKNIDRFPPGFIIEIKDGNINKKESYLIIRSDFFKQPSNFSDVIDEVGNAIANHIPSNNICIGFSGGIDSTTGMKWYF